MLGFLNKLFKSAIILLLIIILCLTFYVSIFLDSPFGSKREKVVTLIKKGASPKKIASQLKEEGLIKSAFAFHGGYAIFYSPAYLKAGEYEFHLPAKPRKILNDLIKGNILLHLITIPEGLTFKEIEALLIEKKYPYQGSFEEACQKTELIADLDPEARNLEGYLFPETYHFPREIKAEEMVKSMVDQFKKSFLEKEVDSIKNSGFKLRDIVILASLIEKETAVPEEKPLVSAVFHNRLKLGMKLDCDPTIIYALKLENRYDGNIRSRDKNLNSPYNTYLYRGLPPGPICNPGKDSLLAALRPASVDYLYFVARNDGTHVFNKSFEEHLKAVRKFQLKSRPGLR
ncbi:MAG: endolytic transglycosylase MltG [Candidatus Aminicenantes bacterium]|nr:endolytic transglycosylase MltG [Candidatus Aminicenantes bacterium]